MNTQANTIETLYQFVNQRPGLEFCNYGERSIYFREMREITKDLHDFRELLSYARLNIDDLNTKLRNKLETTSDRLSINDNGKLQYITGQYFPTEYRPAANRILVNLIWEHVRSMKNDNGTYLHETGHDIRAYMKKRLSRRCFKNYFN